MSKRLSVAQPQRDHCRTLNDPGQICRLLKLISCSGSGA